MKNITINNQPHNINAENLSDLITELNLESTGMALALNGAVIKRTQWEQTPLKEGDSVVVVTAVYGG